MGTVSQTLLARARQDVPEIKPSEAQHILEDDSALAIDVREQQEWDAGHLPGALYIPRGFLELRIENAVPDKERPIVVYCASGVRSLLAAQTLREMGYENVSSLAGGYNTWSMSGLPTEKPVAFSAEQRQRYSRHVLLPEVGDAGQAKLLQSKVLLIGAGGLGSPAAYYLAAAGVGTIGLIDADVVDESNLQRQILHNTRRVGMPKVDSARETLEALNPDVKVRAIRDRLTKENVLATIADYDVIVDGTDNFPTRYLLNDASIIANKPVVHGSVFRFEGQVTVFKPYDGPCYRCLFPEPPPIALAPNCSEAGVLGVLPGTIGLLQATEAVKLLLGIGTPLVGRLLTYDALLAEFDELRLYRNPKCPACGEDAHPADLPTYEEICAV